MENLKPGRYSAKVKDYGISDSKAGKPLIMILFEVQDGVGGTREMIYRGSLNEGKAREMTFDALMVCGLKGDDISLVAHGAPGNALDSEKTVSVVIQNEEYEGKTYSKIAFVNEPGGAAFQKKMDAGDAVTKLAGMNLKNEFAARRIEKGVKSPDPKPLTAPGHVPSLTDDQIPF